jgi:adenylate cyclase class 2
MIEIELKAWLDDYERTRAAVEAAGAALEGEVVKRDLYYAPESKRAADVDMAKDPVFRLRSESAPGGAPEAWVVSAKRREMDDGVESNEEIEFRVEDPAAFREFAQRIGFRPFIVKRKATRKYRSGRAAVELHRVDPLGDFIEIEVLLEDDASKAERAEADREVRGLLARFGVPESKVEPRLYVDLLRRIGAGRPDR